MIKSNGDKEWYQGILKHYEYYEYGEQITQEESLRRKEIRDLKQTLTNTLPKSSLKPQLKKI